MKRETSEEIRDLQALCIEVRTLVELREYAECERRIYDAMGRHPHAPEPHNLLGILLEKQDDHLLAMKHFRAAWALDPAYRPVRQNLDHYASFYGREAPAFDDSDIKDEPTLAKVDIVYDERGIGHVVKR
jgi:Flp pilus assembly protein TadD